MTFTFKILNLTCDEFNRKNKYSEIPFPNYVYSYDSLWPHGPYSPWDSPGQSTGVGSRSLLQGIFPTQGQNPGLPHCRRILYQLSHQGSPQIQEWVACHFTSGSCQCRSWTREGPYLYTALLIKHCQLLGVAFSLSLLRTPFLSVWGFQAQESWSGAGCCI